MVEYKGQSFENNPNAVSEAMQFKGDIYLKFAGHSCMTVYGFNVDQIMDQVKKFQKIEPKAGVVEIYGPENHFSPRTYVDTVVLF